MEEIVPKETEAERQSVVLMDGAMGTELARRGVPTKGRAWSAAAVMSHPEAIESLHRAYADAGATVHTASTFRTTRWGVGAAAESLTHAAVALARSAVPAEHRIAGSLAPARDCYRPQDRPPDAVARAEHAEHAVHLAAAGVDLLLCETFSEPTETRIAVEAALATGVEVWVALTAGYQLDLADPQGLASLARDVTALGASRVFVNCVPALATQPFVEALAATGLPFGVYANAGAAEDALGWGATEGPGQYAALARTWVDLGAEVVGGCCGTSPAHIAAMKATLSPERYPSGR